MEAIRGQVGILARAAAIMVPTVTGVTRVAMEKMQQETMQIRRKNVVAEIRNCVASGRTALERRYIHGHRWYFEPGTPHDTTQDNNSGFTNSQAIGISEHFEFDFNDKALPVGIKAMCTLALQEM